MYGIEGWTKVGVIDGQERVGVERTMANAWCGEATNPSSPEIYMHGVEVPRCIFPPVKLGCTLTRHAFYTTRVSFPGILLGAKPTEVRDWIMAHQGPKNRV